jgi:hypothetical protein
VLLFSVIWASWMASCEFWLLIVESWLVMVLSFALIIDV